jgi:hypothetical protein
LPISSRSAWPKRVTAAMGDRALLLDAVLDPAGVNPAW